MTERYAAFISYSHADSGVAGWLHRAIEGYRFPKSLRGEPTEFGPVPARLPPVFRDRDELPASGDLGSELRAALAAARFQIVLCSPRAAQSKWVNEEILAFKRTHGEHRTLAVIVAGEPYSGGAEECFPEGLRYKLGPDGELSAEPAEPIAADIRPGKDGKRLALLKLLAGISGTRLDQLARRDAARRQRRLAFVAAGSSAVALVTIGLAIYAETQRRVAVEQREMAESSLEFLTGTFEIANPATENPRTITALTILDRASKRAESEFANRPAIAARLLRTTGEIYMRLGLPDEADQSLRHALARTKPNTAERVQILVKLAQVAINSRDPKSATKWVNSAASSWSARQEQSSFLHAQITGLKGSIEYLNGEYKSAANHLAEASREFSKIGGQPSIEAIGVLIEEARARGQIEQVAKEAQLFKRAAEMTRSLYGEDDVRYAPMLQNVAFALFKEGNYRGALANLLPALKLFNRVYDPAHPALGKAYLLLGRIYSAERKDEAAAASFERSRDIMASAYGLENSVVGDIEFYTAEAEGEAGKIEDALQRTETVKRIYDANYGPDDPDQAELLLLRSRILASGGRRSEAIQNCLGAAALQRKLGLEKEAALTATDCEALNNN